MSVAERRRQGDSTAAVDSSLSNLSLAQQSQSPQKSKSKSNPVADSWEDASLSSDEDEGPSTPTGLQPSTSTSRPTAPPPTPSSPSARFENPYALPADFPATSRRDDRGEAPRPAKTTTTASRMIAGALGVRAPRKAEEMRAYEAAAVEKERGRKEKEKAERDEEERRKRSVWDE